MFKKSKGKLGFILLLGILFCFFCLLLVVPCQAEKAPKGKIVVVTAGTFGITGGDCHTASGGSALTFVSLIHDPLVISRPDGRLHPAVAKSWKFSEDAKSLRITIDDRAKFQDGASITAEDVKFSIERAMRPELKYVYGGDLRQKIDRFKILDDHNMIIYFKESYATFFDLHCQYFGVVPKAYVEKVGDAEYAKRPIGAGPFRMLDFKQDVYAEFEAVDNHYRQTPNVKRVRVLCVPEEATILAMLKSGEADVSTAPVSTFMELRYDPNARLVWSKFQSLDSLAFYDLAFPDVRTPFFDVRVRRAASYAINRKAICEKVLHGAAQEWGDILAPYHPGVDPNIPPPAYDPKKAEALLKEAGYPNGIDTTLAAFPTHRLKAQAMASDLAKVGIRTKLIVPEAGIYFRQLREKAFRGLGHHMGPWWAGKTHPGAALQSTMSSKTYWSYVTTPEAEAEQTKLESLTEEKDLAVQARKLSKIYRDSEIRYMLWANHIPFGVSKRVKQWEPNPGWINPGSLDLLQLVD